MSDPLPPAYASPAVSSSASSHAGTRRSRLLRTLLGIGALLLLLVAWQLLTSFVAYTDDAYVRSDLVAMAPQVTGHIITVAVSDNQIVHTGDLLIEIDPTPFQLAVNASRAELLRANATAQAGQASKAAAHDQLASAAAQLTDAQSIENRIAAISQSGAISRDEQDEALASSRSSQARVAANRAAIDRMQSLLTAQQGAIAQAQAELASAEWRLARTRIVAPVDGTINNLNVQVGDTAEADRPLIGIVAASGWRVIANYKQSYLSSLHPGATAWIWLDSHPWHLYRGRIRSIGRGIDRERGETRLLPYVSPSTDWIRLQHRFPVTIDLIDRPAGLTLYMGADARSLIFP